MICDPYLNSRATQPLPPIPREPSPPDLTPSSVTHSPQHSHLDATAMPASSLLAYSPRASTLSGHGHDFISAADSGHRYVYGFYVAGADI